MVMRMMKSVLMSAIAAAGFAVAAALALTLALTLALALAPAGASAAQDSTYRPLISNTLPVGQIALQNDSRYTLTLVTITRCGQPTDTTNRLSELIRPRQGKRWRVDEGCWNLQATLHLEGENTVVTYPIVEVLGGRSMHLTVNGPEGGPRQLY